MQLIDTHAHIYLKDFKEEIDGVLSSAISKGVERIYLPNIDASTVDDLHILSERYPERCFPMMGLHPGSVKENVEEELTRVQDLLFHSERKYLAVGEIGIDLYWDKSFIDEQLMAFRRQIEWARELSLPIVIHVRDAFDEVFEVLDELNDDKLRGIFHCFTGNPEQARRVIAYGGFKMGIGGIVTFKNAGLDKTLEEIPLEHLVLETDSPYLAPSPYRGKQNKPEYLFEIAQKLADIKERKIEYIAEVTSENAFTIFGK